MNRFKEVRKRAGFKTQAELAQQLYVNQTAVSQWERGATLPSPQMLLRLSQLFGVTTDYLLGNADDSEGLSAERQKKNILRVPVLGDVAAGIPIEAIENIVDYEEVDASMGAAGDLVGLRIRGTSMEPRIKDGDVVIIRRQETADNGDTVVVLVNGENATVKRLKMEPDGGLWLLPNNPAFEAKHFSRDEVERIPVKIFGKVIELRGKF